ncbi:MAG: VWA domain-containing protein [Planctomycetota bacterium]|nr:MAG: VWA domain-containing protein [Planctomycetota bacterium]
MRNSSVLFIMTAVMIFALSVLPASAGERKSTGGELDVTDAKGNIIGKCPLKHTSVTAEISGFVARVTVKQTFENPYKDKIEAVYTFPLSSEGAVDEMLMKIGDRTIRGVIKKREEARRIYEDAKRAGKMASLLDQERPNIFTQYVANIRPGDSIEITIKYVELLPYEAGKFTFSFPMVVGPRFMPGTPTGQSGTGHAPDTDEVPDGSKISPPVTPAGTRAGHDIDLTVNLDAGVPVSAINSKLHEVDIRKSGETAATVALKNKKTIPNKDFVLEYDVAGGEVKSGVLVHKDGENGYVTVILIPPKKPTPKQIAPKEMIFVIDRSGSQRGLPLLKAKEAMLYILDKMNPNDTFNVICFSSRVDKLFDKPQVRSDDMVAKAKMYMSKLQGSGGTWMGPAIEEVCSTPAPDNRLRIVTFMTDGYVGNDMAILGMVRRLRGKSRWFPFGTGNSVNRYLLDGMAKYGGGEVEYILLNSPGKEVAEKFYSRISTPILTDVKVEFEGIELDEVYPKAVGDVWAQRPLYFRARYNKAGSGFVVLKGFLGGKEYEQKIAVDLPEIKKENEVLGPIWARAKVDYMMENDFFGAQSGKINEELKEEIIKVALEHHILTQYTSFVAVEETIITEGGKPRKVTVPVEMPDGVSREGVFGEAEESGGRRFGGKSRIRGRRYAAPGGPGGSGGGARRPYKDSAKKLEKRRPASTQPRRPVGEADGADEEKPDTAAEPEKKETAEKKKERILKTRLHKSLIGLAEKVKKEGKDGNLKLSGFDVTDGKVTLNIYLNDNSEKTLKKIKDLGVKILFEATGTKMLIVSIPVEKLEEIAQMAAVRYIEPTS